MASKVLKVSDSEIASLAREAAEAGDGEMVKVCGRALTGSAAARKECALVMMEARAMSPMVASVILDGFELWERFVGSDSPNDYTDEELVRLARKSSMFDELTPGQRKAVLAKLEKYRSERAAKQVHRGAKSEGGRGGKREGLVTK